jgi:hypothetical protein
MKVHQIDAAPGQRAAHPQEPGAGQLAGRVGDAAAAVGDGVGCGALRVVENDATVGGAMICQHIRQFVHQPAVGEKMHIRRARGLVEDHARHARHVVARHEGFFRDRLAAAQDNVDLASRARRIDEEIGQAQHRALQRGNQQLLPRDERQITGRPFQIEPDRLIGQQACVQRCAQRIEHGARHGERVPLEHAQLAVETLRHADLCRIEHVIEQRRSRPRLVTL